MRVRVLSADPDFRSILVYLLEYHSLLVEEASDTSPDPLGQEDGPPGALIVDLTAAAAAPSLAAAAAVYREHCPVLVLTRPGTEPPELRGILAWAAESLPVPLVPRDLIASLRALGQLVGTRRYLEKF